jgi:putative transposase
MKDYLHKATRYLVNHLVSNNVSTLILGYNKKWKQDISIGRKNNQNFVSIPFYLFKQMLRYKCALQGIEVLEQEESYTSKCSFLDNEEICKHEAYLGRRIQRGLFKTSNGKIINADLNGSLNILKKFLQKQVAWNEKFFSNLVEGCSNPDIPKISF